MGYTKEQLLTRLQGLQIDFPQYEHPVILTMEAGAKYAGNMKGALSKNLFLKDKKQKYYIISALLDTKVDLKVLSQRLGLGKGGLRMATEEALSEILQVPLGCVTPLALVNESARHVSLLLDQGFKSQECCLFHPLSNDMTIALKTCDLDKFLNSIGKTPAYIDLEATPTVGKDQPLDLAALIPSSDTTVSTVPLEKPGAPQGPEKKHISSNDQPTVVTGMDDWRKGLIAPKLNLGKPKAPGSGSSTSVPPTDPASGAATNITISAPVASSDATSSSKAALRIRLTQTEGDKRKRAFGDSSPSKRPKATPQYLPSGKDYSKKGPHRIDLELYSIGLPRGLANASKDDSCTVVDMLQTPADQNFFDEYDPVTLRRACAQKFVQFSSLFSRVMDDINKDSEPTLKEELEKKDSALTAATKDLAATNLKLSELKDKIKVMEREKTSMEKRSFDAGQASGVQLCRRRLFQTFPGQKFLQSLHEGLIDAYRNNAQYLYHMGPHIGHYVTHGFSSAAQQAFAQNFEGEFDVEKMFAGMGPSPAFKGNPRESVTHPWWTPVIKSAVQSLIDADLSDPELPSSEHIIYDISSTSSSNLQLVTQNLSRLNDIADTEFLDLGGDEQDGHEEVDGDRDDPAA